MELCITPDREPEKGGVRVAWTCWPAGSWRVRRRLLPPPVDLPPVRYTESMVRPDDERQLRLRFEEGLEAGSVVPAGESPVPVSAGAPGSRPQAEGETRPTQAGRQEPSNRGEQQRGRQHKVKPAASKEKQWGSRADHDAAKAMSTAQETGRESAVGPSGVWGTARAHGLVRNRRDPSARPRRAKTDRISRW